MKRRCYILLLMLALALRLPAQQLVLSGRILFERKENVHKLFEGMNEEWSDEIRKQIPKYKTDQFELVFNRTQTLYKIKTEDENPFFSWRQFANSNSVSTNIPARTYQGAKTIFERTYLVQDSLPAYRWKLTGEYRIIAGYNCRRASTIINDSLYVIAFYTDEIPVSAGPESFQGLPGMILGIVVPRLHLTYFATSVTSVSIAPQELQFTPPRKARIVTYSSFFKELESSTNEWGEFSSQVIWRSLL